MKEKAYYENVNVKNEVKLRKLLEQLPDFCKQFFIGIEPTTSSRTRIAYAYDIGCFFDYLCDVNPICQNYTVKDIPLSLLDELTPMDIEEYLSYLKYYEKNGVEHTNDERGIKRKLASLRSFYRYYFKNDLIKNDPAVKVDMPKIHDKNIIRLDIDEVARLLDEVESGESLTPRQQKYHDRTKTRDLALMTLLLGTGIRVSECVGLDLEDVDMRNNGIKIHRKGGAEVVVYFGEEVREALLAYMVELPENNRRRRQYQRPLSLLAEPENQRAFGRKSGQKICKTGDQLKAYYTAQTAQYLRHLPLSRDGGYLSGRGCTRP